MIRKLLALLAVSFGLAASAFAEEQKTLPVSTENIIFLLMDEDGDADLAEVARIYLQLNM